MAIIDAQVHCYERDKPERPWHAVLPGPPEVTGLFPLNWPCLIRPPSARRAER